MSMSNHPSVSRDLRLFESKVRKYFFVKVYRDAPPKNMSAKRIEEELKLLREEIKLYQTLQRMKFKSSSLVREIERLRRKIAVRAGKLWSLLDENLKRWLVDEIYPFE
ncbi:MAG: hypothetical protein QXG39_00110 [Candidatus Aenigmatarchaeota archaeon]